MCRLLRNCHSFPLTRNVITFLFILVLAVFILAWRFDLYTIQVIQSQKSEVVVRASFRPVETFPVISSTVEQHVSNTQLQERNNDRRESSNPYDKDDSVTVASPKNRETDKEKQRLPPCVNRHEKSRFRELSKGVLVFSVWFDHRKAQPFIRILLLLSRRNSLPLITCTFESASRQTIFKSGTVFYEHKQNHYKKYGGFIASCIVPRELERIPCSVNVSITLSTPGKNVRNTLAFPVGPTDRIEDTNGTKYGICIPPVHGNVSVVKIIELIELTTILGASHFTFYDLAMTETVRNVLSHYENKGLVSVLEWNLPEYIGNNLHYHGQVLSIMDCLYRSMRDLRFVAFHDLDEFIVPLRHDNMNSLLREIHKDQHCGHCFESVVFDPSTNQESTKISPLITQRIFYRTNQANPRWTKCVVDPQKIFEQGIHHISKSLDDYYDSDKVDWDIARVFHYRKCHDPRALTQLACPTGFQVDKTMQKFGSELMHNFRMALNATN
ncbi:beta-1,4-galactosyltransferase galt-1-like [Montipora capricornis]|uniref:beta-1,4-galactosyltransferase galt-1-like n=1 Tax=Montipora capricornis TaxID=246305 RepID=UPI0035F11999